MRNKGLFVLSISIFVALVLFVLPFVSACSGGTPSTPAAPTPSAPEPASKSEIVIGFSTPVTGIYADGGISQLNANLLWADYVNEKGGINVKDLGKSLPVRLVYYDDKSDPEQGIKIYERLATTDKVDFLVGNWGTRMQTALIPTIEKYKIPCVGGCSGSLTWKDMESSYFFGTGVLDNSDAMMPGLVELMSANKDKIKTVAILYCNDVRPLEDMSVLKPLLDKEGFNIVLQQDYPIGVTDLASPLLEIKSKNPDALIGLSYPGDTILMVKQEMELGVNPKMQYNLVGPGISAFKMIFGDATEGIFMMGGWTEKGPGDSMVLYDRWVAEYGMPPDYLDSADAWVAVEILKQAIEKAGTLDKEKVTQTLATATFENTIKGSVQYDGAYVKNQVHSVLQWQKNGVEMVWPPDKQTANPLIPKPAWPAVK